MAPTASAPPATLRGRVERAFYYLGKVLPAGDVVELPRVFALEMKAANKFTFVLDEPAPAPVLVDNDNRAAATPEAKSVKVNRKEASDARS